MKPEAEILLLRALCDLRLEYDKQPDPKQELTFISTELLKSIIQDLLELRMILDSSKQW